MSSENVKVPPGVSGNEPVHNLETIDTDTVTNELALSLLGDFEPLKFKINTGQFMGEISHFDNDWVDYLPRTDRANNRQGLSLTQMPGNDHQSSPSLAQATVEQDRKVFETEFKHHTQVFDHCHSLHEMLNFFEPLGRTFLVKSNIGGYFMPHRDHPVMPRETFRIAVFLNNCEAMEYDWIIGTEKKVRIEAGRAYYINTRLTHRTISWVDNSIHLIVNVPMTTENVTKCIAKLQHSH